MSPPPPEPATAQSLVAFLAAIASIPLIWSRVTRALRAKGRGIIVAHVSAAVLSFFGMLAVFAVFGLFDVASVIYAVIVLAIIYLVVKPTAVAPAKTANPSPPAPQLVPAPPLALADPQAIEVTRRQSLAAMKHASEARKQDKAARHEEDSGRLSWQEHAASRAAMHAAEPQEDDDPLANWRRTEPPPGDLAQIEFDYVDARGKASHRVVDVTAVDKEYLEGFCHEALATRTFVIGRVRGKVTDLSTGEMLPPKRWAARVRDDPRNGEVTMGGERRRDDEDEDEGSATDRSKAGTEILFTGFPKAQRQGLEEIAESRGWKVVKSVTVGLTYLCTGANAGPTKMAQAAEVGAAVIDVDEFLQMSAD